MTIPVIPHTFIVDSSNTDANMNYAQFWKCILGPTHSLRSDGIKRIMCFQMVNVMHRVLEEQMGQVIKDHQFCCGLFYIMYLQILQIK